jgi:hypothetical protein
LSHRKRNVWIFLLVIMIISKLLFSKINIQDDIERNSNLEIDYSFRYSQIKGYFQEGEYTYFIVWKGSDFLEMYVGCLLVYSEETGFVNAYKYIPYVYSNSDRTYMASNNKYFCLKIADEVLVYSILSNEFSTYPIIHSECPNFVIMNDELYISEV